MNKILNFIKNNKFTFLLCSLLLPLLLIESKVQGDFDIFISASRDLFTGGNIYQIMYHEWYHYYYDVLFALLISPLQFIPIYWANFIWLLFNIYFTYRIWKIILFYIPIEVLNKKKRQILTIVSFAFIFALWHKNIHLTQMTIFILYISMEGLYQIENKKPLLGSCLISFGISVKILPIVLIAYFVYRGNFKVAISIIFFLVLILLLPALVIGYDYNLFLLGERWKIINPLNAKHILDVSEISFHSLSSLLSILLVENAGNSFSLELKRNIANVNLETLKVVLNIVRAIFILGTLYFIGSLPFRSSKSKLQSFYELSYILLITPLIFPHQQHYGFFFAFPAITYLVFYYIFIYFDDKSKSGNLKKTCVILYIILIYFLLNSHFILGAYRTIYDHYKTLTYGILLIIPMLAFAKPNKIFQQIAKNNGH